jgi:hypothetical protein
MPPAAKETKTKEEEAEQTVDEKENMEDMPEATPREEATTELTTMFQSHFDTHALTGSMFSLSSKDAFVYYAKDDHIVARLCIPAGFPVVVTTEILSGRKDVNPYKLKHYSESADDRTLVRLFHEAPQEELDMGRTSEF